MRPGDTMSTWTDCACLPSTGAASGGSDGGDTKDAANGPNRRGCAHGSLVDAVPDDSVFTCDCSATRFTGDNCEIASAAAGDGDEDDGSTNATTVAVVVVVLVSAQPAHTALYYAV